MVALAFANDLQPVVAPRPHLRLVPASAGLTHSEVQAVEIGRRDAFRYGWEAGAADSGWLRGLIGRLTGISSVMPLADSRLETLRLFAAMMRRDDRRVHAVGEQLLADGLSATALHEAISLALA